MRRSVCGLMMVLTLVSCTSWSVNYQPLPQLLPEDGPRPSSLRIRTYRHGWISVRSPRLRNDSLIWIRRGGYDTGVPVSEITMIERPMVDQGATAGLIVLSAVSVGFLVAMIGFKNSFDR
jgi:hypothetical protein